MNPRENAKRIMRYGRREPWKLIPPRLTAQQNQNTSLVEQDGVSYMVSHPGLLQSNVRFSNVILECFLVGAGYLSGKNFP